MIGDESHDRCVETLCLIDTSFIHLGYNGPYGISSEWHDRCFETHLVMENSIQCLWHWPMPHIFLSFFSPIHRESFLIAIQNASLGNQPNNAILLCVDVPYLPTPFKNKLSLSTVHYGCAYRWQNCEWGAGKVGLRRIQQAWKSLAVHRATNLEDSEPTWCRYSSKFSRMAQLHGEMPCNFLSS